MRWLRHMPRKRIALWVLMAGSAVSLALPARFSDGLKSLTQLLVPAQDGLHSAARRAAGSLHGWSTASDSSPALSDVARQTMENQLLALTGQLEEIRRENSALRGLRERYLPPGIRLVTGHVAARDAGPWRDTLLLSRGSNQSVQRGDAVTSRLFVGTGENEGISIGHLVVAREVLIGQVDQVNPFSCRVQLFSDIGARTPVRIGRVADGRVQWVDYSCVLLGQGRGEMLIRDVPLKHIAEESSGSAGAMRVGDRVVCPARPPDLPTPMAIGRIAAFEHDPRKRLVATVRVEPLVSPAEVNDVFIIASGNVAE